MTVLRRISLRARLAVASALIAAALLSLLSAVLAMELGASAVTSATRLADADLLSYVVDLRSQPREGPDVPSPGLLILVESPDGAVARDSMPDALASAARRVRDVGDVDLPSGRFRVVHRLVDTTEGTWRLWAARDVTASGSVLGGVRAVLLVGTPTAVLLTAIAAWLVATAALGPVERMRSTAERLRRDGGSGLLPISGGQELAALATTLNDLIADLRASVLHERRVTADAAHELRTPLAVLAAQVELAQRRGTRPELTAIRESTDRLARLVDDLLALSRADSSERDQTGSVVVSELVTEAMAVIDRARLLAPPSVLIDLALDGRLDETRSVRLDPIGFGRITTNLVMNALSAGPASSILVRLGVDGHDLLLTVQDDGPGIPPEFLPFAFDRFARPDGARRDGAAGSGLGLALVRRLAERAGGSASLRNASPGAIATVRIPTVEAHDRS